VVRAELDLTREIENDISVLSQHFQPLIQPVEVLIEILHTVQHPPVRAKAVCIHDISEGDQGRDVDRARVWDVVVRWVKVYDGYRPVERGEKLVFAITVGGFSTTRRTDDDFTERHFERVDDGVFPTIHSGKRSQP